MLALFVTLMVGSYSNLMRYRFGIINPGDPLPRKALIAIASVYDAGLMVVNALGVSLDDTPIRLNSPLKDVRLRFEVNAIKEMASNLPSSAKAKYYDGKMQYPDGSWQNISFRFRGRSIWHWHPDKPSLRLKLRRSLPLNLQRHINLVNPEDLTMVANYYGELLGQRLGVLTHKTEMVRVFVNNSYFGVYQMTTREDENMLRANGRMPGPIFIGDHLGEVWEASQFEKAGDLDVLDSIDPMSSVIEAIYESPSPERYLKLWSFMDRDKMACWIALLNLSGGIHTDYSHNHSYYFDPTTGKLEPLVSDILAIGTMLYPGARDRLTKAYKPDHKVPINERLHPLLDTALRDPIFYDQRNQKLYKALVGEASTESQHALLAGIYDAIDEDVKADRKKAFVMELFVGHFRMPYANRQYEEGKREAFKWVSDRNSFLIAELEKSNVFVQLSQDENGDILAQVSIDGHAAADIDLTGFSGGIINKDKNLNGDFQAVTETKLRLYPGLKEVHDYYYEQVKAPRVPEHFLFPGAQNYLFRFSGLQSDLIEKELSGAFVNAVTGRKLTPEIVTVEGIDPSAITYNTVSQHAWSFPEPSIMDIVLGPGIVDILETIESDYGQIIRVMPGTTLRLAPDVSIISKGPLKMVGDVNAPIKVKRLDLKKAWGVIAVQGELSSGSRIKESEIVGGSIATALNINYSGMVSFHWSGDVKVESSHIRGNVLGDDTLHIVHGDAVLTNIELSDCFGDCIDFDYADVTVDGLRIRNAGNDALDFMTSHAHVVGADMDGIGDKGVSGGEGSKIELIDVRIANAVIGVGVKDESILSIRNSHMASNEVAIDVYKKNWRYTGSGRVHVYNTEWDGNQVDIRVLDGGEVEVFEGPKPESLIEDLGKITIY